MLINEREKTVIIKLENPKELIGYLQTIDDVFENLENHNPIKEKC